MDIIQIVELVGAAVGGGWISHLFSIRARVRTEKAGAAKAETEVKADQIENIEKMMEKAYTPIIENLTEQVNKLQDKVDKLEADKDRQEQRIGPSSSQRRTRTMARAAARTSVPIRSSSFV